MFNDSSWLPLGDYSNSPSCGQVTQEAGLAPKWAGRRLEGKAMKGRGRRMKEGMRTEDEKEKQEENDGF